MENKQNNSNYEKRPENTLKRHPERGSYDVVTIRRILDATFLCHISFFSGGRPLLLPTIYGRKDDTLYIHGSAISRMLAEVNGSQITVCVTILDGLVLARGSFFHSCNYRSAVLFCKGRTVSAEAEKLEALRLITEQAVPGRWSEARMPSRKEIEITGVVALEIETASAKIRDAPPYQQEGDGPEIWTGVIPLKLSAGQPVPDERARGFSFPEYQLLLG